MVSQCAVVATDNHMLGPGELGEVEHIFHGFLNPSSLLTSGFR